MRITNKFDLPESYWRACAQQRTYTPGRISVTELLQPPQMRSLIRQYPEIEIDCSDMLELFFGNAVHAYLASFADSRSSAEERIEWTDPETGWVVHGTPDLHETLTLSDTGALIDWKTTRVRALQYDREEWKAQVNLYAHLLRLGGKQVSEAVAWVFCKDYDPQKRGEDGYPAHGLVQIPVELWPEEWARDFLARRLRLHEVADRGMYGPCTDEERWMRGSYAVVKHGNTRASAVFDQERHCYDYIDAVVEEPKKWRDWYRVDHRPGAPVRCQAWCPVSGVCKQWEAERPDTLVEQLEGSIRKIEARP